MEDKFEIVWRALFENGSSNRNRDATFRFWNTLTVEQQQLAAEKIPQKVAQGKYVQYDPIRAIKENIRTYDQPQPEWKTGGETDLDLVQVKYNGRFKICTRATMELFGLEWVRDWN